MKYILVTFITFYQWIISPIIIQIIGQPACRYEKSCSQYAKEQIMQRGVIHGSILATKRIISCQPFSQPTKQYV